MLEVGCGERERLRRLLVAVDVFAEGSARRGGVGASSGMLMTGWMVILLGTAAVAVLGGEAVGMVVLLLLLSPMLAVVSSPSLEGDVSAV